jgi:hypothetical protein
MAMVRAFSRRYPIMIAAMLLGGCLGGPQQEELMHVDCMIRPDPGPCKNAVPGFYYDYLSDRCISFTYGGCNQAPPFGSMKECIKECGAEASP